jgi:type I restriction enzyme S subunit
MSFSNWQEVKLVDVINFKNGRKKPDEDGDIPIYGGNGILGYTNNFNNENVVVIGRVGAYCGSVYYEPGECWISDNAISAQPINDNNVKYAYYALLSLKLNERRIGTGQPLLTQSILNNIDAIYPRVEEQKAIADTLSCLDDKIELNNRINKTLNILIIRITILNRNLNRSPRILPLKMNRLLMNRLSSLIQPPNKFNQTTLITKRIFSNLLSP